MEIRGTQTAEGLIPTRRHSSGIDLCVRLNLQPGCPNSVVSIPAKPLRTKDGRFVYALPGGGSYVFGRGRVRDA